MSIDFGDSRERGRGGNCWSKADLFLGPEDLCIVLQIAASEKGWEAGCTQDSLFTFNFLKAFPESV